MPCTVKYDKDGKKPKFTITQSGFYRNRCGEIAFVTPVTNRTPLDHPITGHLIGEGYYRTWTTTGFYYNEQQIDDEDLIELIKPYSEEMLK